MNKITIDLYTGSRAEYGILRNLIRELKNDQEIELRIIATGMHLEEKYGSTYKEIINDGYEVFAKIDSNMQDSSEFGIVNSFSTTTKNVNEFYKFNAKPDAILILGDRFEIFSVAIAAGFLQVPVIHLHGGEITEGNFDEFIRHSITKIAQVHFTAAEEFSKRVIQLGENPKFVHNVGALGVENVKNETFLTIKEINEGLKTELEKEKYIVCAFHPETLDLTVDNSLLIEKLEAKINEYKIVLIGTNSDTNADIYMKNLSEFEKRHPKSVKMIVSTPSRMYHSLIKHSAFFIGNSSSGLIEVPTLGVPSINIGDRQKGRLKGNSVIDCKNNSISIEQAIDKALNFKDEIVNPYEGKNTKKQIKDIIKNQIPTLKTTKKQFFDKE